MPSEWAGTIWMRTELYEGSWLVGLKLMVEQSALELGAKIREAGALWEEHV